MSFKFLYLFTSDLFDLCEVKNTSLPDDAAKEDKYKWLIKDNKTSLVIQLNFVSSHFDSDFKYREFDKAQIKFNQSMCELKFRSYTYKLNFVESSGKTVDSTWIH